METRDLGKFFSDSKVPGRCVRAAADPLAEFACATPAWLCVDWRVRAWSACPL